MPCTASRSTNARSASAIATHSTMVAARMYRDLDVVACPGCGHSAARPATATMPKPVSFESTHASTSAATAASLHATTPRSWAICTAMSVPSPKASVKRSKRSESHTVAEYAVTWAMKASPASAAGTNVTRMRRSSAKMSRPLATCSAMLMAKCAAGERVTADVAHQKSITTGRKKNDPVESWMAR